MFKHSKENLIFDAQRKKWKIRNQKTSFSSFQILWFQNQLSNSTKKKLKITSWEQIYFQRVANKHPFYIFNQKDYMIAYLFSKCMPRDEQCRAAGISNKLFYLKKNWSNLTSRDCILCYYVVCWNKYSWKGLYTMLQLVCWNKYSWKGLYTMLLCSLLE